MKKRKLLSADYEEEYFMNDTDFYAGFPGIHVHSFCHSLWQPNYQPEREILPHILVYMILDGEEDYVDMEGDRIVRKPGFFSMYDLNYDRDLIHKRKHPLERYFVLFEVNHFLNEILKNLFPTGFPRGILADPAKMKSCFEDIRRVFRKKGELDDGLLGALGFRLLQEASRQFSKRSALPASLLQALQFMDNQFCNPALTREDIAREAGISTVSLGRLFQTYFHETVNQRLVAMRLERAKHLLKHTQMPVAEIALQCGFSSSSYFSRVFREKNSVLPMIYRKENNSGNC